MDCELPNNDGRAEGSSWVHGTASEVDLVRKCRTKNEGFEAAWRRTFPTVLAQIPPPPHTHTPHVRGPAFNHKT